MQNHLQNYNVLFFCPTNYQNDRDKFYKLAGELANPSRL